MGVNKNYATAALYQVGSICETAVKHNGIFIKMPTYADAVKFRQKIYNARLLFLRQIEKKGENVTDPIATVELELSKEPPGIFIRPSLSMKGVISITAIDTGEEVELNPIHMPSNEALIPAYCAALERNNRYTKYTGSWDNEARKAMAEGLSLQDIEDGRYSLSTEFLMSIAKK